MTRSKLRRFHVALEPPHRVRVGERRITFVGANFLNGVVMIEYEIQPPLQPPNPFGPHIVVLRVRDDTDDENYPTVWEDFIWTNISESRTTTRLDRRPPAAATRLVVDIHALPASSQGPGSPCAGPRLSSFQIPLPAGHGDALRSGNT